MLIPYSTDAPIYHLPFTTIGLIVVNIAVFCLTWAPEMGTGVTESADPFLLHFDQIAPWQWLTTNFLHAGIGHLLGNMVFMWAFSLIVEGKIGWWKYLAMYMTIGTVYGAIVQLGMLLIADSDGVALGASGVIYGIMAVAVCWAPRNEVSCMAWFFGPRIIELPVSAIGFGYFALQLMFLAAQQFQMSSEMLHMVGIIVGLPIGVVMIKQNWVDCEGHDLISEMTGSTGPTRKSTKAIVSETKELEANRDDKQRVRVIESINAAIAAKNWPVANSIFAKEKDLFSAKHPIPSETLLAIIQELHRQKEWAASIPAMTTLLEFNPGPQPAVRLKLAQILIQISKRPHKAVKLLEPLKDLPPKQEKIRRQLLQLAEKAMESDDTELEFRD